MNRFKNIVFPDIGLDFEFIEVQNLGECYGFKQKGHEICFKNFDVLADLDLCHYPEASIKKSNSFKSLTLQTSKKSCALFGHVVVVGQ